MPSLDIQRLNELNALYLHMQEGVCIHEIIYDDKGNAINYRITDVNPAYEKITSLSFKDTVGRLASDVYGTGEPPFLEQYARVAETGKSESFELYWSPIQKHFNVSVISTKKHHFATIFFDITDIKQAQENQKESQDKYLHLFHRYPIGLVISNISDGKLIECNDYIAKLFGYKSIEDCLTNYSTDKHYATAQGRMIMLETLRKDGELSDFEVELKDIQGNRFWVSYSAHIYNNTLEGAAIDITDKKRNEKLLFESEERYKRLALATHEAIAISKNGKIIDVSKQIFEIYGYSPDEFSKLTFPKLVHPDDLSMVQSKMKNQVKGPYQHRGIHKDGSVLYLEIRAENININGEPHRLTVIRDNSELMNMQEQLSQSEKMQAIGQLAGGIAHDFNNQLTGIVGYADILYEELRSQPTLAKYVQYILQASKRSSDLTSQLLAFAHKGKYLTVDINIHEIVEEVIQILTRTIDKKINLIQNLKASHPITTGDPTQIQNALMNLAINARDALPDGGDITLSTENLFLDAEFCQAQSNKIEPGKYLAVFVADNGIGMEPELQKKIFEPFFTTKAVGQGTGMGLASVYGTIKNHGGAINVYSESGRGTTMKIYLPQVPVPIAATTNSDTSSLKTSQEAHIVVVDDEPFILNTAATLLEKIGYKVTTFQTGKACIRFYEKHWKDVELVILDMIMPELSGKEVFSHLKKINPDVKTLLSSGYSVDGEAQSILDIGVMGFLQKPFTRKALADLIFKILHKS